MARPTTKKELHDLANKQFDNLFSFIETMNEEEKTAVFLFEDRDKNIRDILIHLYEWHQLLINWISSNEKGIIAPFLLEPYNWRTYPQMNVDFWEKHQNTSYEKSIEILKQSHKDVMNIIDNFSNDELFSKKMFSWTGTTTLGSYCVSSTSSHYDWAIKKIKKHIKTYRDLENKK